MFREELRVFAVCMYGHAIEPICCEYAYVPPAVQACASNPIAHCPVPDAHPGPSWPMSRPKKPTGFCVQKVLTQQPETVLVLEGDNETLGPWTNKNAGGHLKKG